MSQTQAQQVPQSLDEVQSLRQRLGTPQWRDADWGIMDGVLASSERMFKGLLEAQITLKRLLTLLFGKRRRRTPAGLGRSSAGEGTGADDRSADDVCVGEEAQGVAARDESGDGSPQEGGKSPVTGGHRAGYGRLEAEAYPGAQPVECRHEELAAGPICPVCGQGRFYGLAPGVEMRLDGNAVLSAMRSQLEKLRGSACGEGFTAALPQDAAPEK